MPVYYAGVVEDAVAFGGGGADAAFLLPGAVRYSGILDTFFQNGLDGAWRFQVAGTVWNGVFDGIDFQTALAANADTVIVTATGLVSAPRGAGVRMTGDGQRLVNDGAIDGQTAVVFSGTDDGVIDNRGTIIGTGSASTGLTLRQATGIDVANAGTISGAIGITVDQASVRLDNTGVIRATDNTGTAIVFANSNAFNSIVNSGLITAPGTALFCGVGVDLVRNSGTIVGKVLLSGGDDLFFGRFGRAEDGIFGAGGDDQIGSGRGDDFVNGGTGNDTLRGWDGQDTLAGDIGTDRLRGGADNDSLTGGEWRDTFIFGRGDGADTVTDFTNNQDRLDLRELGIDSFAALSAQAVSRSGGLLIDLSDWGGGTVMLAGFNGALFTAPDVIL